ncbi:MAG: enhanced serine sensitivity protein SseB [Ruminococcus sp.]
MENNQKEIRNDELLEAIKNMQENNSDETVNRMIDCVMAANFITPGNVSRPKNIAKNNGGNTVMQQQTQIQFQLIENQNGEKFFPAFTDQEEKAKWEQAKGKHDVIMTFDNFAKVLSEEQCNVQGFVINPFGRSVAFPKPMVMSLKQQKDQREQHQGLRQQSIGADEKVHIGDPAPDEYPIDMMASIISFLQERDDVNAAYLRMFKRESQEDESYLVIVDFSGDKMEEIFKGISAVSAPHLGGLQLSMMPYSIPFARKAVDGVEPFFEKE